MSEEHTDLAAMSREQLLRELAQLETERDALQAEIGAKNTSPAEQTRATDMRRQAERIQQIGEILASRQE